MADYTKGIRIKTLNSKYGEFMSVGINIEEFATNPINERGYVNLRLYKSKAGEWYAVNEEPQDFNDTQEHVSSTTEKDVDVVKFDANDIDDAEITF